MFDEYYTFNYLGESKTLVANPYTTLHFRFKAKFRRYFVIIEFYDSGFAAIKYCDIKDKKDKHHAFKKIFNDNDAFKVIGTCLHIMRQVWRDNPTVSFAFYAVPRNADILKLKKKSSAIQTDEDFIRKYIRARFNIYEYAMLNLFPPQNFIQMKDYENSIYILLNRKNEHHKKQMLSELAEFLLENHDILFEATDNENQKGRPPREGMRFG